jgi:putative transposase
MFANQCYHVLNRANRRAEIFHHPSDYHAFVSLMAKAQERFELPIIAACLMPNHLHFVVRPKADNDVARWTQWLFTTHVRHYHEKYQTTGRLWQGRYKAFLVQDDHYLLTLIRYVERNAARAKLVDHAEKWRWGSLNWRGLENPPLALATSPTPLPSWWTEYVNQPQTAAELESIRTSVNRQRPYGDPEWVARQAKEAKLDQSLIAIGRPRKIRPDPFC